MFFIEEIWGQRGPLGRIVLLQSWSWGFILQPLQRAKVSLGKTLYPRCPQTCWLSERIKSCMEYKINECQHFLNTEWEPGEVKAPSLTVYKRIFWTKLNLIRTRHSGGCIWESSINEGLKRWCEHPPSWPGISALPVTCLNLWYCSELWVGDPNRTGFYFCFTSAPMMVVVLFWSVVYWFWTKPHVMVNSFHILIKAVRWGTRQDYWCSNFLFCTRTLNVDLKEVFC